ncbi:MAG: helix-turn-helix domain-containing protein [Acidobacteria bacterium]|nr:helix-turn-helix domain-containing protein [Acidobacteriota bacterium]
MGNARRRPKRLAEKLLQIRNALGISQSDLYRRLGVEDEIPYTRISDFELDKSEPILTVLMQYARVAGVHTEALIDDTLDLPDKLPGDVRHDEIKRKYTPRGGRKR